MEEENNQPLTDCTQIRRWIRFALKGLLLTAVAGAVVIFFAVDDTNWSRLRRFPLPVAGTALAMVLTAWMCNGLRTWIMARALGHPIRFLRALGITLSMEFAIAATPGGVGGWVSRCYFQKRAGISLPKTLSMMAADLSADAIFFLMLMPFALTAIIKLGPVRKLVEKIDWTHEALWGGGIIVAIALLVWLLVSGRMPGKLHKRRFFGKHISHWWDHLRRQIRGTLDNSRFLMRERRGHYFAAFVLCCVQWCCRYGVLPLILWGLGSPVDPLALMLLQGCLFLLSLAVVAPGGGGALEILSTLILGPLVGAGQAAIAVVLWRLFTYYLYILGGSAAFFIMLVRDKPSAGAAVGEAMDEATTAVVNDPESAHMSAR